MIRASASDSRSKGTPTRNCARARTTRRASSRSARSANPISPASENAALQRKESMKQSLVVAHGATAALAVALASHAYAADPIKVGVVTPLSGSYAPIGKQVRWGAELAVKEINAAGGVKGRPFELLFEDEEANPPVAARKAEKLLRQKKTTYIPG